MGDGAAIIKFGLRLKFYRQYFIINNRYMRVPNKWNPQLRSIITEFLKFLEKKFRRAS